MKSGLMELTINLNNTGTKTGKKSGKKAVSETDIEGGDDTMQMTQTIDEGFVVVASAILAVVICCVVSVLAFGTKRK
jgi:hypothetical protein